ncbi:MAG: hypothetical protein R6X05_01370 [Desulfobacterales bacterium]
MPAAVEASEPSTPRRWVQTVTLAPPTLKDNTADADRLAAVLKGLCGTPSLEIGLALLQAIPDRLRQWHYRARCLLFQDGPGGQLVALTAPDDSAPLAGLAVDLGTTRVVLRLVDLETGRTLGESAFDNPQIAVGPDILVRIQHAESDGGRETLRALIVDGLNAHLSDLSRACGLTAEDVYLAAVAGNTAMTHLFMGLPARWIIREPYTPAVNRPGVLSAAALGLLVNPAARVLVFPNIGSYFGGDLIAGILFAGLHRREAAAILVDVGMPSSVGAIISSRLLSPGSRPTLFIRTIGRRAAPSARTIPPEVRPTRGAESRPDSTPTQVPSRTMSTAWAGTPSSS